MALEELYSKNDSINFSWLKQEQLKAIMPIVENVRMVRQKLDSFTYSLETSDLTDEGEMQEVVNSFSDLSEDINSLDISIGLSELLFPRRERDTLNQIQKDAVNLQDASFSVVIGKKLINIKKLVDETIPEYLEKSERDIDKLIDRYGMKE